MNPSRRIPLLLVFVLAVPFALHAQVTSERLSHATNEPQNWLLYSGGYASQRHSLLKQVDPSNVKNLELKWVFQAQSLQKFESTPLVVDGVMYLTQSPNDIVAVDANQSITIFLLDPLTISSKTSRSAAAPSQVPRVDAAEEQNPPSEQALVAAQTAYIQALEAQLAEMKALSGKNPNEHQ